MSAQDLEQRARELLADEYEFAGMYETADGLRGGLETNEAGKLAIRAIVAALRRQPAPVVRDRELDRKHFPDAAFNEWLDTGISDAGHTVWDAVGDTQAAWAGWDARPFPGDAVMLSECCGREECGGECGDAWLGMRMYRKPTEQPAPVVDDAMVEACWQEFAAAMGLDLTEPSAKLKELGVSARYKYQYANDLWRAFSSALARAQGVQP